MKRHNIASGGRKASARNGFRIEVFERVVHRLPPLFNIFHQVVMRVAKKERERRALESGKMAGIVF